MSAAYRTIGWNRAKLIYDAFLLVGICGYLLMFIVLAPRLSPAVAAIDTPILRMRAFGSCAFILLSLVLAIGPLARLETRFLPLLYNRRHFGVMTACVAGLHGLAVLDWYFAFSPTPQLVALFSANDSFGRIYGFPFELLGVFALLILVVMAVTSHDFWLSFLTPPVWKSLHMAVYFAYAAVVLHVVLGPALSRSNPFLAILVTASVAALCTLHLLAARRSRLADAQGRAGDGELWLDAGDLAELAEARALVVSPPGAERIAIFRHKGGLSALSNVCSHQNGPLGEGRVIRGFATCPWHGYQYRLEDGCSPPPFRERVHKFRLRLDGSRILVDPRPLPLGTRVAPLVLPAERAA